MERRTFIRLAGPLVLSMMDTPTAILLKDKQNPSELFEARYYEKREKNRIQCQLCFRQCLRGEDKRGFCRNRENIKGKLYTLVYNRPCAIQIDPIEKEPMLHLLPGTTMLCTGTASCNFRCLHCHNWHMSHSTLEELNNYWITPKEVVTLAIKSGCKTVSFTYNEPTVFYEFMFDIIKAAKEKGLKAIFHTNGSMNPEPLKDILEMTDGVTVDLKAFTQEFYTKVSRGKLAHVMNTLGIIKEQNVWLEVVNLVIPTLNDQEKDIKKMCKWIYRDLGRETPLHFSRFYPSHKLTQLHSTPIKTLERAHGIAKSAGLEYVTIGNVPGHEYNSTFCPKCGKRLIHRVHFEILENNLKDGKCRFCDYKIAGVWV